MSKAIADPLATDEESQSLSGDILHATALLQRNLQEFDAAYRKWYSLKNESGLKERAEDYLGRFDEKFRGLKQGEVMPMLAEGIDHLKALTELAVAQAKVEELGRRMCVLTKIVLERKDEVHELGKSVYNRDDSSTG